LFNTEEKRVFAYAVLIKKNVAIAVKRNYYKRIVREYIRKNIKKFNGYNNVVFLFNKRCKAKYRDIKNEFDIKLNMI
jgi:ribonuclease P protein component